MRYCTCLDWEPNIKAIDASMQIASIHHFMSSLTAFRFCPYCSKQLIEREEEKLNDWTPSIPQK